MNVEYFIAKKLFTAKKKNNSYTKPILRIAILAIALSVAVMLIAVMVVTGFKNDISSKIIGFGSHITINNFTNNQSYESEPISINQAFYPSINDEKGIKNINVFATKAAIIKTIDEIHGVVLKGVSSDYDWTFFNQNLVAGEVLNFDDSIKSNNILISEEVSKILKLDVSDDLVMYFVQDPPRARKFKIKGIYNTAMVDFDKLYVLGDIKHIQALNSWENTQVGGFEIAINNFNDLDAITQSVYDQIPYDLYAQSIKEKTPQIFDWLNLQDINVRVILILMLIVGAINMITALLILILERTRLIGILKALGATNWSVRKVFLYSAVYLIIKGLILGNAIAIAFALLQEKFTLISLDPETYYMNTVPIN
ncbi:MAG: FtsX-like permease family protein, partial [Bacteroidota bacterium]|nr:FtsX-like permease family protein [Bacteroidota bacterium]